METKQYTRNEFLTYLAEYQDQMMIHNQPRFMLIYMALQTKAETTIVLRRVDFAILCTDLQLDYEELTFIDIDQKVMIQKSMI
tara:strand:+ start:1617 stop:1865 length:249 start_codon:yes stop_codon:yes gene_type:complete